MTEGLTILNDLWMWVILMDVKAADVLYHLLGGKESHTVFLTQKRRNGWNSHGNSGNIVSCEMLARDKHGLCHSMTIRFIDNLEMLSEIREHPLGDLWEYQEDGKDLFCRPATKVFVYFIRSKLPGETLLCRAGFPMMPDDLDINTMHPTIIISTETDDGSELSKLVQYLKKLFPDRTTYGALSERISVLAEPPGNQKRTGEKQN